MKRLLVCLLTVFLVNNGFAQKNQIGDFEIEWKFDVASFLEYYSSFMSLAGMEKMTGINQKQLSNYLNHRAVPRKKQTERIREGIHKFAHELLSITL